MSDWVPAVLLLLSGLACAGIGGEVFLRGAVLLAALLRLPSVLIGMTVAAFATSSPELAVAISAAVAHQPEIAVGDALGSNVVNVALILGLALVLAATRVPRGSATRDLPVALAAPVLTAALVADGTIGRLDAVVMAAVFAGWLAMLVWRGLRDRALGEAPSSPGVRLLPVAVRVVSGVLLLAAAGKLIVTSAKDIGALLGLDTFVVGATIVAVGTGVPELATTIIARLRGEQDIALGTIIGSNIFNGLCIIPVAALITPPSVPLGEVAIPLAFGFGVVLLALPGASGLLSRGRGALLLACYAAYVVLILAVG